MSRGWPTFTVLNTTIKVTVNPAAVVGVYEKHGSKRDYATIAMTSGHSIHVNEKAFDVSLEIQNASKP